MSQFSRRFQRWSPQSQRLVYATLAPLTVWSMGSFSYQSFLALVPWAAWAFSVSATLVVAHLLAQDTNQQTRHYCIAASTYALGIVVVTAAPFITPNRSLQLGLGWTACLSCALVTYTIFTTVYLLKSTDR